jgi:hypothetical protein
VAADDDVLDFQNVDGILNHRKTVQVGVNHQVGDVTVNKQFAGLKAGQSFCGNAAVRTSNPQKARFLRLRQFFKKPGSSSTSIFDHSALLLMSVSMSFMDVYGL